jgi:hypothetical protein
MNGDGRAEIIGSWSSDGFWYWDVAAENWTQMTKFSTNGDIAAGDFTNDGIADVASIWPDIPSGSLWYQDGSSGKWFKVPGSAPDSVTAGDVTGDGRPEIIGTWSGIIPGIWYWDVAASEWTRMTSDVTDGDIAAGDFTGDGIADVASVWLDGLWYQDGDTLKWTKVTSRIPFNLTAGDVKSKSGVIANAGGDQKVQAGDTVTLDGSGSNPGGGTFAWVLTVPEGSTTAALSDPAIVNPTFTPDVDGTYTVELTYTVGEEADTDTVEVVAKPVFADAGPDLTVQAGEIAFPNGIGCSPSGGTYAWELTSKPLLSNGFLAGGEDEVETRLQTDLEGTYTVTLTYTVGADSDTDTVVVTAVPEVQADAGRNKAVAQGVPVNLNGGASTPEGGTFSWAFLVLPPGSDAVLGASDTISPFFTADEAGYYIIELTYTVGLNSDTDFVAVFASP